MANQTQPYGYGYVIPVYTSQPYNTTQQPVYTVSGGGDYEQNVQQQEPDNSQEVLGEDRKFRDVFFLILFLIHLGGIVAIIVFGLLQLPSLHEFKDLLPFILPHNFTQGGGGEGGDEVNVDDLFQFGEMVLILIVASLLISVVFLELLKRYTELLIYIGIAVNVMIWGSLAIMFVLKQMIVPAIVFGIMALFVVVYYFFIRFRIPFAVLIIQSTVSVIKMYPATQVTAYASIFVKIAWVLLWIFCLFLSLGCFRGNLLYAALAFLIFSFYWVSEVIKNIVHVTVSGVIATNYFMKNNMPENPTLLSLKRSLTTSIGSICLGSLIVSIIKTLRFLFRSLRSNRNNILICCINCALDCIDHLVRYFNHYAFCQVAIYGKTFVQAAKDTWELFKYSGLEAIVNDNLVDSVLWLGVIVNSILTGLCGVGVGYPYGMKDPYFMMVMFIIGFVIGFTLSLLAMQTVESGVACTFVCFAEDRVTLQRNDPKLYRAMMESYHLTF